MTEKVVYSVKDIQDLLDIGKNQAYQLLKEGKLPYRKIGNIYRISKVCFDRWLNECDDTMQFCPA